LEGKLGTFGKNFLLHFLTLMLGLDKDLSLILYILEKHLKNLKIPVSILLFVNDGLFIVQSK